MQERLFHSREFALVSNRTRMQQALGQLSEEQQAAIRLRYVDGLNTKDIAAKLNKTDVAIRVLLSRSVRQLFVSLRKALTKRHGKNWLASMESAAERDNFLDPRPATAAVLFAK